MARFSVCVYGILVYGARQAVNAEACPSRLVYTPPTDGTLILCFGISGDKECSCQQMGQNTSTLRREVCQEIAGAESLPNRVERDALIKFQTYLHCVGIINT